MLGTYRKDKRKYEPGIDFVFHFGFGRRTKWVMIGGWRM